MREILTVCQGIVTGERVQAWDKSPRVKGARRIGTIRLTEAPVLESTSLLQPADWLGEGFQYLTEQGLTLFRGQRPMDVWIDWHNRPRDLYVVRFELVEVL